MERNIPSHIIESVEQGQCTLFLGAGTSRLSGAPSSDELSDEICAHFLKLANWGLGLESTVSLASAQPGRRNDIEDYVRKRLLRLVPSTAHKRIPWFRWRAIVTTNYDQLVEKAYEGEPGAVQELIPIIEESDLAKLGASEKEYTFLLKPHGCISQPRNMSMSLEDVYQAKRKRRLLFTHIEMLHLTGPVIYIGYSFRDVHILDMIYDLTNRLGIYRKPILFVTLQDNWDKAEKERMWFERTLQGEYLACGFDSFMDELSMSERVTPAIGPSWIVKQMAPCRAWTFAGNGEASYSASHEIRKSSEGEWECWLNYTINHEEGYAGVVFERMGEPVDVSKFKKVVFELNVPDIPRKADQLEALKLESHLRLHVNLVDVSKLKGEGWIEVSVDLDKYDVDKTRLRRIVLADNGHRAELGRKYKVGLRKVRFE